MTGATATPGQSAKSRPGRPKGQEESAPEKRSVSCLETPVVTSHFHSAPKPGGNAPSPARLSATNPHPQRIELSAAFEEARSQRQQILERLWDEGETELATSLEKCGEQLILHCAACGHQHVAERRCSQKWCPVCVRKIATLRSLRFERAAATCQWPLFVTLTRANLGALTPSDIRDLRRKFGRFRRLDLWANNVKGGLAAIEITNTGKGWHPHLHCLLDCRWLAVKTPEPKVYYSRAKKADLCKLAAMELERAWSKCLGQLMSSVHVKRTTGDDIVKEVCKYAVKGSDLIDSKDPIGPAIWAMKSTRLVTTFGTFYGKKLILPEEKKKELPCPSCSAKGMWVTEQEAASAVRDARRKT